MTARHIFVLLACAGRVPVLFLGVGLVTGTAAANDPCQQISGSTVWECTGNQASGVTYVGTVPGNATGVISSVRQSMRRAALSWADATASWGLAT